MAIATFRPLFRILVDGLIKKTTKKPQNSQFPIWDLYSVLPEDAVPTYTNSRILPIDRFFIYDVFKYAVNCSICMLTTKKPTSELQTGNKSRTSDDGLIYVIVLPSVKNEILWECVGVEIFVSSKYWANFQIHKYYRNSWLAYQVLVPQNYCTSLTLLVCSLVIRAYRWKDKDIWTLDFYNRKQENYTVHGPIGIMKLPRQTDRQTGENW